MLFPSPSLTPPRVAARHSIYWFTPTTNQHGIQSACSPSPPSLFPGVHAGANVLPPTLLRYSQHRKSDNAPDLLHGSNSVVFGVPESIRWGAWRSDRISSLREDVVETPCKLEYAPGRDFSWRVLLEEQRSAEIVSRRVERLNSGFTVPILFVSHDEMVGIFSVHDESSPGKISCL